MFSWSNFLWILPPDSSAARMPLPGARRVAEMSSRLSVELGALLMISCSSVRVRVEFSLEFSILALASLRLSSTDLPKIKLPRMVEAEME